MPKLRIKYDKKPAISIARRAFRKRKLVYLARANKKRKYPWGRSRIVYIGTTRQGAGRIASSAVWKGEDLLFDFGIRHLEFHVVTCASRQSVASWRKLERAMLIRFKETFVAVPRANTVGKHMHWDDEKRLFSTDRLDQVIQFFS
jgi:hypothetical protein